MIGYYVHNHGTGHLSRARAIAAVIGPELTGLSTQPRPPDWPGEWILLADDADPAAENDPVTAGRLHYVPRRHPGLRARMGGIAAWIDHTQPAALVVDVSVEVALLARLHGVPVLTVAQPGNRTDAPHTLGYQVSDAVIAPWPPGTNGIWQAAPGVQARCTGAIGRFSPFTPRADSVPRRVVVLNGTGGAALGGADRPAWEAASEWDWVHLGGGAGGWVEEPWPVLCEASVVVSHCGQSAVAEIAAARRPAILLPQSRPFGEQFAMAAALRDLVGSPATVLDEWPDPSDWPALLDQALARPTTAWEAWNDGRGAERAAAVIMSVALDVAA